MQESIAKIHNWFIQYTGDRWSNTMHSGIHTVHTVIGLVCYSEHSHSCNLVETAIHLVKTK